MASAIRRIVGSRWTCGAIAVLVLSGRGGSARGDARLDEAAQIARQFGVPEGSGGDSNCTPVTEEQRRTRGEQFERLAKLYRECVTIDCGERSELNKTLIRVAYYYLRVVLQCGLSAQGRAEAMHVLRGVLIDAGPTEIAAMFSGREVELLKVLKQVGKGLEPDEVVAALEIGLDLTDPKLQAAFRDTIAELKKANPEHAQPLQAVDDARERKDTAALIGALHGLGRTLRGRVLAELGRSPESRPQQGERLVSLLALDQSQVGPLAQQQALSEASINFRNGVLRELTQLLEHGLDAPPVYADAEAFERAVRDRKIACRTHPNPCDVLVELRLTPLPQDGVLNAAGAVHIIEQQPSRPASHGGSAAEQPAQAIGAIAVPIAVRAENPGCRAGTLFVQQLDAGAQFVEQVALRAATYVDLASLSNRGVADMGAPVRCGVEVYQTAFNPNIDARLAEMDHATVVTNCSPALNAAFTMRLNAKYRQYLPAGTTKERGLGVELSPVSGAAACQAALKDGSDVLYAVNLATSDHAGPHAAEDAGAAGADYLGDALRGFAERRQGFGMPGLEPGAKPPEDPPEVVVVPSTARAGHALISTGLPLMYSGDSTIRDWGLGITILDTVVLGLGSVGLAWSAQARDDATDGASLKRANTLRLTASILLAAVAVARLGVFLGYAIDANGEPDEQPRGTAGGDARAAARTQLERFTRH